MNSATVWGWSNRKPLRVVLACAASYDAIWLTVMTRTDVRNDWPHADPGIVLRFLADSPVPHVAVAITTLALLWRFALRAHAFWTGVAALAGLALLYETNAFHTGFLMPEVHASGSVLLGWLVGSWVAHVAGPSPVDPTATEEQMRAWRTAAAERLAEAGAVAGIVANYALSAASKWLAAGAHWDGRIVRRLLFAFRSVDADGPIERIADYVATHAWLPDAMAGGTLIIQTGAVMLLVGTRWRVLWGVLLVAMHLGMTMTAGVFDAQLWAIAMVFFIPWPTLLGRSVASPSGLQFSPGGLRRALKMGVPVALGLIALAWLLPIRAAMTVRQNVSQTPWDRSQISHPDPTKHATAPQTLAPLSPEFVAWLGPLRAGAGVGKGKVATVGMVAGSLAFDVQQDGATIRLHVCTLDPSSPRPPALAGALAVYYAGDTAAGAPMAAALAALLPASPPPKILAPMQRGQQKGRSTLGEAQPERESSPTPAR